MASDVVIRFIGDASSAVSAVGKIDDASAKVSKTLTKTGLALTAGLTVPLVAAGTAAIRELESAGKVAAQTNAVLKSTGGVANVSAEQVTNLATAIAQKSGMDDEAVASGENLLLTFTRVRNEAGKGNDVFTQATKLSADLSVAWGIDMSQAATKVGKALNDPVAGISALQKVGVTFTAEQKTLIQSLVETGDVLGAQKVILGELETQVGGSAAAYGETLAGQVSRARETLLNTGAAMVSVVAPALETVAQVATKAAGFFAELPRPVQTAVAAFGLFAAALGPILTLAGNMGKIVRGVGSALSAIASVAESAALGMLYFGEAIAAALAPLAIFVGAIAAVVAVGVVLNKLFFDTSLGWKEAESAGKRFGQSLISMSSGISDLKAQHDQLAASARDLKAAHADNAEQAIKNYNAYLVVKDALRQNEDAQRAAASAERERQRALADLAFGTRDLAAASDEARAAVQSMTNAFLAAQGGAVGYQAAQLQVEVAEQRAAAAIAVYGATSIEARQATNDLAQAKIQAAQAAYTLQANEADLASELKTGGVPALVSMRDAMLRTIETQGDATGATQAQIDKIDALIDIVRAVPPEKGVTITANVVRASNDLAALLDQVNALPRDVAIAVNVDIASSIGSGIFGYATGGVVPGPRGAPQLAIVHGGETITPPRQATPTGGGGGSGGGGGGSRYSITVNVPVGANASAAGAAIVDAIRDYERVAGRSWRST